MSNEFIVKFKDGNVLGVSSGRENIDVYSDFQLFFDKFTASVSSMTLKHQDENTIYTLSKELIDNISTLLVNRIEEASDLKAVKDIAVETIARNLDYIRGNFQKVDTRYKRQKIVSSQRYFVPPQPKAIGLKWQTKQQCNSLLPSHNIVQTTMQYIPILDSLKTIFSMQTFKDMYFKFNADHNCQPDVYERFCCGSVFKSSDLFKDDRCSIQIEISSDDFEICCPLKSKATIHKICAVYFQIKNIPDIFKSKTEYIFLVCLCNTDYLKSAGGFRNINELIVSELKILETDGIEIQPNEVLRGSLANVCADNLGANSIFGYSESFNSTYYCRHCELDKETCQAKVQEVKNKVRDKASYEKVMDKLKDSDSTDLKKTKGYKKMCLLNALGNFHMLDNWCVDVMHDVCEGAIPFLLFELFNHWIQMNILSGDAILHRIRDFNYGVLDSRNKPLKLSLDKKNLGQNSSQLYCIMTHLPFIFSDIKEEMGDEWKVSESLLKCLTIIFSHQISETSIQKLEVLIEEHLNGVKEVFGKTLIPKQHFLTHYPTFIRKMGPPISSWMMRFEAKHQQFTDIARKTKNFKNITKSLAVAHQENVLRPEMYIEPSIQPSKINSKYFFGSQFERDYFDGKADIIEHKFLYYSSTLFKKGLFIWVKNQPYEIDAVVSHENDFFVICNGYEVIAFSNFFNSIEINKRMNLVSEIFNLNDITKITFEKKFCNQTMIVFKLISVMVLIYFIYSIQLNSLQVFIVAENVDSIYDNKIFE